MGGRLDRLVNSILSQEQALSIKTLRPPSAKGKDEGSLHSKRKGRSPFKQEKRRSGKKSHAEKKVDHADQILYIAGKPRKLKKAASLETSALGEEEESVAKTSRQGWEGEAVK